MNYKKLTTHNPSSIKRFSHGKRFKIAASFAELKKQDTVLDYGTGNGALFVVLNDLGYTQAMTAYEPVAEMYEELTMHLEANALTHIRCITTLKKTTSDFDTIFCLEVLEHFNAERQKEHLSEMLDLLGTNGQLIISVPIEIGFASLVKNCIRYIIGQKPALLNLNTLWRAFLGKKIERNNEPYIYSHIGFNHKELEAVFKDMNLKIIQKKYAPIPLLGALVNSQILYKIKKS